VYPTNRLRHESGSHPKYTFSCPISSRSLNTESSVVTHEERTEPSVVNAGMTCRCQKSNRLGSSDWFTYTGSMMVVCVCTHIHTRTAKWFNGHLISTGRQHDKIGLSHTHEETDPHTYHTECVWEIPLNLIKVGPGNVVLSTVHLSMEGVKISAHLSVAQFPRGSRQRRMG
jgi:hypothetical protein